MKSFVIFAIVVTIIYVIYYTVIIVQDLYGKPKDEKSQGYPIVGFRPIVRIESSFRTSDYKRFAG